MSTALQTVIDELRKAFPPHPLDSDRAFGENGTTYLDGEAFQAGIRGQSWDTLDSEFLEFHHDVLVFLPPESFVEYLPAFLTAVLKKRPELNALPAFLRGVLTRSRDAPWFDSRIQRLTPEQQYAVAYALEALEVSEEFEHNKRDMADVLDSYWRTFLDRS